MLRAASLGYWLDLWSRRHAACRSYLTNLTIAQQSISGHRQYTAAKYVSEQFLITVAKLSFSE
jgi:hypothetical protein